MKYESLNAKLDAKLAQYQAKIAEKMFNNAFLAEESRQFQEEQKEYLPPVLFS
jgi:hypothetical protein